MRLLKAMVGWAELDAHLEDEHDVSIAGSHLEAEDARRLHADHHRGRPSAYAYGGHVHEEPT